MDNETKQWIVDRVIWIIGLAVSFLVAATAIAGEHTGLLVSRQIAMTAHGTAVGSRIEITRQGALNGKD